MTEKLDPYLLQLTETDPLSGDALRVLIGLTAEPDAQDIAQLEQAGLTIGSIIGNILTASVCVKDLRAVADCPQVERIEGGTPLMPEGPEMPFG
jgi:hypothetical protein